MEWIVFLILVVGGIWLWQSRQRKNSQHVRPSPPPRSTTYVSRMGRSVEADESFHAWTSGDLVRMARAINQQTNPIDRHFLLMEIVNQTYKNRKDPDMAKLCVEMAEKHLAEFPNIAPALKKDMGGVLPRVTTFQHYATLLSERGDYQRAMEVCEEALRYGLHDNTKGGFEARIDRIKRKQKTYDGDGTYRRDPRHDLRSGLSASSGPAPQLLPECRIHHRLPFYRCSASTQSGFL